MPRKMLETDKLLGMERECPDCGRIIPSNGRMYYDTGAEIWGVSYFCPFDREEYPRWTPELQPLIEKLTAGVDVAALPDEPTHSYEKKT